LIQLVCFPERYALSRRFETTPSRLPFPAIVRLAGAMLEQNDEWAVQRRCTAIGLDPTWIAKFECLGNLTDLTHISGGLGDLCGSCATRKGAWPWEVRR